MPRLPELLASETAYLLAQSLADQIKTNGAAAAADWLIDKTSELPLGDIIGAQAIWDCAQDTANMPLALIERLLTARPRKEKLRPGARAAMHIPGVGLINLTFPADGTILAQAGNNQHVLTLEDDELSQDVYADVESWLILSHVAGRPFVAASSDGAWLGRADPTLLWEIGSCPTVLRRPVADQEMNAVLTHDLKDHGSIVCHDAGIVEPITFSILKFLEASEDLRDEWIDEAMKRNSLPLLSRIDIALRHIAERGETPEAQWARQTLRDVVAPAFKVFPGLH